MDASNQEFLHNKGNNQQIKKTTYEVGQNSANQKFDKGLTFKIHKELMQLSLNKKTLSKMGKGPVLTFLKRSHTNGQHVP